MMDTSKQVTFAAYSARDDAHLVIVSQWPVSSPDSECRTCRTQCGKCRYEASSLASFPEALAISMATWSQTPREASRRHQKVLQAYVRRAIAQLESDAQKEKPVDMVQWMAESARGSDRDPDVLAHNMLFMVLAGVHTSSATIAGI